VKTRIVPHGAGARSALRTHVSYLGREQGGQATSLEVGSELASETHEQGLGREVDYLSREEQTGRALNAFYDARSPEVDARALTKGWADDVRHFRLIISPEDGADLGDLRPFVREVMDELGRKLGTRLEWVGVDHWDTDNPHSHVLVRGRRADGAALIIPNRLLTQGIREHAQEVATRVLGPRQEVSPELARRRTLELDAQRLTPLDREIIARSRNNVVALPERGRTDLIARLNRL
jgi:type IV secretory pathway VirD2 relaxase